MRIIPTETQAFKFSELSEEAKQKALEQYRAGFDFSFHSECTLDDAKDIAALFGLDIDKIYYSGFWSQGDGVSFIGNYRYKAGALKAVMSHAPSDKELHSIVKRLQEVQRKRFYGISCRILQRGNYVHEYTMLIDEIFINGDRVYFDTGDIEDEVIDCLRDYARWIYKRLESEYEYLTSDESIAEYFNESASNTEFTIDGEII
jgi:hypothetical protein